MKLGFITIFPELIDFWFSKGLLNKALKLKTVEVFVQNPRDFTIDKHKTVDDSPYGGGAGMVMKVEPLVKALEALKSDFINPEVIALSPGGKTLDNSLGKALSKREEVIFLCGRYEGVDQRFIDHYCSSEISLGDFVLMGGEVAAMAICETLTRFLPGVLGNYDSVSGDSFYQGKLSHQQYTRPIDFNGLKVPEVLLSGNHKKIADYRQEIAAERSNSKAKISKELKNLMD